MSATDPAPIRRLTISDIARMHADGERIPMLTAYDYPTARILDDAGIPMLLVGDSLGQVMLGYDSTVRVTMDEMLHHTRAVTRGARRALVVGDMPFLSYASVDEAIEGADVVMMLRVQRERLEQELGDEPGEYLERYGLTQARLARAKSHSVVMHPGPMNRGVEIDSRVADDPERSLITLQVEMGVAVRMACLEILIGSPA